MPPASYLATDTQRVDALWVTVTEAIDKLNRLWTEVTLLRSQVDKLSSSQSDVSSLPAKFRELEEGLLEALVNIECRLDVLPRSQTVTTTSDHDLGPETTDTCLDCMD
ncbi:unnamed protein product [Symbiodinium sp. CCMP2592]|nr:unnamed protein product [Symbiodinium sp. CCMP2592]